MEWLFATRHDWMEEDALQQAPWNLFNTNNLHRMPLQMKNKMVVFGTVERGSFSRYDKGQIVQESDVVSTAIWEAYLYDCEENTIDLCLRANMGKHQLFPYESGWLVLDTEESVEVRNIVVG